MHCIILLELEPFVAVILLELEPVGAALSGMYGRLV
jgi:hypothetical protein